MLSWLRTAGLAILIAALPAAAPHGETVQDRANAQATRIVNAFKAWSDRWGVSDGSIAVMQGTRLLGSYGQGAYTAKADEPVASLSKAITGVCVAKLVDAGKLKFQSQLKTVLKAYFNKHPPADPRARTITVGQLLSQVSGIAYDPSQASQGGAIETLPLTRTNLSKQVDETFSRPLASTPGSVFAYNNMNYAVLGLIIESLTKESYEDHCFKAVLAPVGVAAAELNPPWRVMASWGGWKISAIDYARFLAYFLPSLHLLDTTPAQWPKFDLGGGAFYSLGTAMRQAGSGYNFWHSGSWQWSSPQVSFGSYFTVIQENVRYAVNFSPAVGDSAFADLDSSLYNAAVGAAASSPSRLDPRLLR